MFIRRNVHLSALLASGLTFSSLVHSTVTSNYTLVQDFTGDNFFKGFNFETIPDPTNGLVNFVSTATANESALAGLFATDVTKKPSTVYLGMDSTTKLAPSQGRDSVRLSTNQTWNHALVIADISHMPSACGAWPALWMLGTSSNWPDAGEIDIVEGVNDQAINLMTLHTNAGVSIKNDSSSLSGSVYTADCDVNAPNQAPNTGCQIQDNSGTPSFGDPFNQNGGGVFAMEWTSRFIKIWFFPRDKIPSNVLSTSPDPAGNGTWGKPNAMFEPQQLDAIDSHFKDQQLIVGTTLCGDWAGNAWNTSETCASKAPTCDQYVADNPAAFSEAYWAIDSLQVFQS